MTLAEQAYCADATRFRLLLIRARNVIVLELRREAYAKLPEPTDLLLEIDAALGIEQHTDYEYLEAVLG